MTTYSSKSAATTSYGSVSSLKIEVEDGSRTCDAYWEWQKSHTTGFTVRWDYRNVNATWTLGNESTVTVGAYNQPSGSVVCDSYDAPDDAYSVRVYVKPVSDTRSVTYYTSSKKTSTSTATVAYFTATYKLSDSKVVGVVLDAPSISAEYTADNQATLTIGAGDYDYAIYRYSDGVWTDVETSAHVRVPDASTRFENTTTTVIDSADTGRGLVDGHSYRYATRPVAISSGGVRYWGEYSDFSDRVDARPAAPTDFTIAGAGSNGSYYFTATWTSGSSYSGNNETYRLRWSQTEGLLEDGVGVEEDEPEATSYTPGDFIDDIDAPWYFAVRAETNDGDAVSDWVHYDGSIAFGETPSAPTVSSVPSYAEEGATIALAWTHNSVDGSTQTAWLIEGSTDSGSTWSTVAESDEDTATLTSYGYTVGTLGETSGGTVRFRVSTAGATGELSATTQTADVSVIAVLQLSCAVASTVESLPVEFICTSNMAIRLWQLEVTAAETYTTSAINGDDTLVAEGQRVYSTQLVSGDEGFGNIAATVSAAAADCDIVDGATYAYLLTAVSVYGTDATDEGEFYTNFNGEQPEPIIGALYDDDAYECHLFPACYSDDEGETVAEGVTLDVYRRDPNGDLLVIAEDVENTGAVELVDTHCNFGTSTYRVRAVDTATGMVGFMDCECECPHETVELQFEDGYRQYTGNDTADQDESGIIELPYNLNVVESYSPDGELVEYIGNSEPTLYTGTQRGAGVNLGAALIRSADTETVAQLRRLAGSMSRVYYRDPTGLSFWGWIEETSLTTAAGNAAVEASFTIKRILGDYTAGQTTEVSA